MDELKPCPFCGGKALTNDERREVAARLRELASGYEKTPTWSVVARDKLPAPIDDFMQTLGLTRVVEATEIFYRIAGLIEPATERTCRMERVEWYDHIGDHEIRRHKFVCSNCGLELEAVLITKPKYPYQYCPKCGAKVVEE